MAGSANYTMRDVARLAKTSVATVSAVINGTVRVSPELTKRVREAMEALDYYPDQVARSLRTGRSHVVGMVVPSLTNPFFPEVAQGVDFVARREGYSVMLCDSNEDPEYERRHLDALFSRRVDGVLIACSDSSAAYDSLVRRRFPIVFFDRIPENAVCAVTADSYAASRNAIDNLLELGHERVAIIAGKPHLSVHRERVAGYRKSMQQANLPVRDEYFHEDCRSIEEAHGLGLQLLRLPSPPTAIFATHNRALLGLTRAVNDLGIPCPEQLSIVGFDDYTWTQNFNPKLTTIAQPTFEIGQRAMEMLVARIRGPKPENTEARSEPVVLQCTFNIRGSTASPSVTIHDR